MTLKNYLVNTRQKAVEAERRRPGDSSRETTGDVIKAVVLGANGGGYDVQTVDKSGAAARIFQRVYAWPSDATLAAGDEVWLCMAPDGDSAEIVVSGSGGGGGCATLPSEIGVYFD